MLVGFILNQSRYATAAPGTWSGQVSYLPSTLTAHCAMSGRPWTSCAAGRSGRTFSVGSSGRCATSAMLAALRCTSMPAQCHNGRPGYCRQDRSSQQREACPCERLMLACRGRSRSTAPMRHIRTEGFARSKTRSGCCSTFWTGQATDLPGPQTCSG